MINRRLLISQLLQKQNGTYLEIGVFKGYNFYPVKAKRKIAVDPFFRIPWYKKILLSLQHPINILNSSFFEKESDRFFAEDAARLFKDKPVRIALVDGMHEYEFALRDVENVLRYLENDGVIIMHDCNPVTYDQSVTFEEWKKRNFSGIWNGDVWKAILHLRSMRDDINVFVLDCDTGLGVVTKGKQEKKLSFQPNEIKQLTYQQLEENRTEWLNLKPAEYFFEYFHIPK